MVAPRLIWYYKGSIPSWGTNFKTITMFKNSGFIDKHHKYSSGVRDYRGMDFGTICSNCGYAYGSHSNSECNSTIKVERWGYKHFSLPFYNKCSKIKVL